MIRAVVFDMDGVLVDSESQWKRAEPELFKTLGLEWSAAAHERFVGLGVFDLFDLLARDYGLKASKERFFELSHRIAEDVYLRRVTLAGGALRLLADLRRNGLSLALASSSPRVWIRMVLDRFHLEKRFDAVVSADDVEGRGKPSPAVHLRAARLLKVPPGDCLALEDSAHGVEAAKRAGMRCLAYRDAANARQDLSAADGEIPGFEEVDAKGLLRAAILGGGNK